MSSRACLAALADQASAQYDEIDPEYLVDGQLVVKAASEEAIERLDAKIMNPHPHRERGGAPHGKIVAHAKTDSAKTDLFTPRLFRRRLGTLRSLTSSTRGLSFAVAGISYRPSMATPVSSRTAMSAGASMTL